jgi:hypothetical protein
LNCCSVSIRLFGIETLFFYFLFAVRITFILSISSLSKGRLRVSILNNMQNSKPLGIKAYGSIPHLPGSRVGIGDYHVNEGQARIATEKPRDQHDLIIVQEKLDGSNVAVTKVEGQILALNRAGYVATTSPYQHHHLFAKWVAEHNSRFAALLNEKERLSGEWLALAHGTRYELPHEPFVAFDLIQGSERTPYHEFKARVTQYDFTVPWLLHIGGSFSVEKMIKAISKSGHGALDEVEGAIWRIERKGKVDFLCKYVHHHKQDGKYFPEVTGKGEVWNCDVSRWLKSFE